MTSTQTSKEAAAEEAATEKRLKAAKELLAYVSAPDSTAAQTVAAYADLLDDVLLDVALDVHRKVKIGQDDLSDLMGLVEQQREGTPLSIGTQQDAAPAPSSSGGDDAYGAQAGQGQQYQQQRGQGQQQYSQGAAAVAQDLVSCMNCGRKVVAGRFAPHLEKCMGKGSRSAGYRAVRRKPGGDFGY